MLHDIGNNNGINLDRLITVAAQAERLVGRTLTYVVLRAGPRTRRA